jgi:exonuclease SbcD
VLYNTARTSDHAEVLDEIENIAREFKPHLIIHSGDVWDLIRPAYVDLRSGIERLSALAAVAPIVVLCGNHDSPLLFDVLERVAGRTGRLVFVPRARPPREGGILEFPGDKNEIIRVAPVPFIHQNRIIDALESPDTWMTNYADRVQAVMDVLGGALHQGYDPSRHILLLAAHLHVTGARFSHSERQLHVTDTYASRVEGLPKVSYAAYGHIHRPQKLPGMIDGRYAGSPIPLDFGEEGELKSVVAVEAHPGRPAHIEEISLKGGRPLVKLEGNLEMIRARSSRVGRALVVAVVDTEKPTPDLTEQVQALLPKATLLQVAERCAANKVEVVTGLGGNVVADPGFKELFSEYLSTQTTKGAVAANVRALFDRILIGVDEDEVVEPPELAVLRSEVNIGAPANQPEAAK